MADWKKTLGAIAPTIATALGGPIAGLAAEAIGSIFGLSGTPSASDVQSAIESSKLTGDQIVQLRDAENAFKVRLRELDIDEKKLDVDDRSSARQREIAVKDKAPIVLGLTAVLGFFGILVALFVVPIPDGTKELLLILLGALAAIVTQVYNYYFGSSAGSAAKNEHLRVALSSVDRVSK